MTDAEQIRFARERAVTLARLDEGNHQAAECQAWEPFLRGQESFDDAAARVIEELEEQLAHANRQLVTPSTDTTKF